MGLFGGRSSDSKTRIEELKKKIQAEQQALANPQAPAAPSQPQSQPAAPAEPQPAPVSYQQPPPMPTHKPEQRRRIEVEELFEEEEPAMEQVSGIVLDLGDGMSLNLPMKAKMRLDEFLHIADRVREFRKIEHY